LIRHVVTGPEDPKMVDQAGAKDGRKSEGFLWNHERRYQLKSMKNDGRTAKYW